MPADFSHLDEQTQEYLNKRYGVSKKKPLSRWLALALLIVGIPWLIWSAWHHSNPEIRTSLVSFNPIDEESIDITFDLTRRDPSISMLCTVVARDIEKNVVGERDISIAPSTMKLTRYTAKIPTRLRAVNADILRCAAN